MHIETLRIFCDLVNLKSFSLAAERNLITQSAVSQQIRTLEEKFDRRLLERVRGRRDVELTPAGEILYRDAQAILSAFDQLGENLRALDGTVGGTVKVATIYSVGLHELPPRVREFMSKYPSARIDLEYSRMTRVIRDVVNGSVDLGVLAFPEPRKGLTVVQMPANKLVLICPAEHPFASRAKVTTKELDGLDFVHFERDMPTRKIVDRMLREKGAEVKKAAEFDNIETIKRAVEVGFGVSIVPIESVRNELGGGRLAAIPLAEKEWVRPVGVIYRSDRTLTIAAAKFVQLLKDGGEK